MNIQKSRDEILANLYTNIGCTFMLCQLVESQLKSICDLKIEENSEVQFGNIFSEKSDKRMLGILLMSLCLKFDFPQGFEINLKDFVKRRNILAHSFGNQLVNSYDDFKQLLSMHIFVSELRGIAKQLNDTLSGVAISIASNHNSPLPKKGVELLFNINEIENNQYIEQMKKMISK